ncbi:hypothetical protein HDZ31DRAFT_37045 [Schizophyllum fasciatum]
MPNDAISTGKPAKRRKVGRKSGTSSQKAPPRGKLASLAEFPLDIMYEIFCHLHPAQLLSVSRANKTLRETLLRKSAQRIWRASFENETDDPPVPEDLNEPQYARLLFDKSCMYCSCPNASVMAWAPRTRCCKRCLDENFVTEVEAIAGAAIEDNQLAKLYLRQCVSSYYRQCVFERRQTVDFFSEYDRMRGKGDEELREWLAERFRLYTVRRTHELDIGDCERGRWINQARAQIATRRQERWEAIRDKLCDLGWEEEVKKSEDILRAHKMICNERRLTYSEWRRIESRIVDHVALVRAKRIEKERRTVLHSRYKAFANAYHEFLLTKPLDAVLPAVANLAILDEVRATIEGTPLDVCLPPETYTNLVANVPASWYAEWRQRADADLVEVLNDLLPNSHLTAAHLQLAYLHMVYVPKTGIGFPQQYPDIIANSCVTDDMDAQRRAERERTGYASSSWSAARIVTAGYVLQIARELITLAGMDPDTTTREDIELRDPWFMRVDNTKIVGMRWSCAVSDYHFLCLPLADEALRRQFRWRA